MTQNQLAYQANLEKERSNRAQEEIGRRNAEAQMSQAHSKAYETRLKDIETQAKRADYESQIARRKVQSGVDIANAVTGGLASIGKAVGGAASLAGLFI